MSEWNEPERMYQLMDEMRTALDYVISKTAMAGIHLDDTECLMRCLSDINDSTQQLLDMVDSVMEMSRLSDKYQTYVKEPFQLGHFFTSTVAFITSEVERKHQQLSSFNGGIIHEQVVGDLLLLQNACMRLLRNAVTYTESGGTIQVRLIEVPTEESGHAHYQFQVEDTGIGMDSEAIHKALSPYAKDHMEGSGNGLGLPVALKVFRKYGGGIEIESTVGKGTIVTADFYLQLQETSEMHQELLGKRALIYEWNQSKEEELKGILEQLGAECTCISDKESLETHLDGCEAGSYDLIFVNSKVAVPDVATFVKELRDMVGKESYIILTSPYSRKETSFEAEAAGADGYVQRPLYKAKLLTLWKNIESIRKEGRIDKDADGMVKKAMATYFNEEKEGQHQ